LGATMVERLASVLASYRVSSLGMEQYRPAGFPPYMPPARAGPYRWPVGIV
jgi:hypothetical protein